MNIFKFLKWFFKNKKTASITPTIILGVILALGIFKDITETINSMWVFYTIVSVFFIGYYLVQYRYYLRMKKVEELKSK